MKDIIALTILIVGLGSCAVFLALCYYAGYREEKEREEKKRLFYMKKARRVVAEQVYTFEHGDDYDGAYYWERGQSVWLN